ncbi:MAG: helix-hairpin-helix domain-containing protein [Candidatus Gastranaerophilales bacterium]|nr:helix-hairpin-helix domain-containing protein [Candidatus Gastranaerophilales bacterium]
MKKTFPLLDNASLPEKFFTYVIKKVKRRNQRIYALKKAAQFIVPYENIFSNLMLANKFCTVKLLAKDKMIVLKNKKFDKNGEKLSVTAYHFPKIDADECFNHMCNFFGYKTAFEECLEVLTEYAKLKTEIIDKQETAAPTENLEKPKENAAKNPEPLPDIDVSNKVDINNSSESELIGLPGINIILAKKIIKYREEEHQFYSVDEFFRVMKIKPHFEKQLRNLILVRKINIQKVKKARKERIIDI